MNKIQQFNIVALTYDRLKNNNFDLSENLLEAERNEELIALADNECLRAIRRITKHKFSFDGEIKLVELFDLRKRLVKQKNSEENRRKIAEINNEIREFLYIPDIISITVKNKRNYPKLGRDGFKFNGKHYRRLLCSAAMARTNRAMFCTDEIYEPLDEILRCGCKQVKIVPAKWNAYYSLMSSASYLVSMPRVCVVKDLELDLPKEIDWVTDSEHEDTISREVKECRFNLWDGMGLISPEQSKKWSEEIGYGGIAESFIVRAPFIKGLLATFDFHKFSKEVAHTDIVKDIYGKEYHCDDIDVILTESQFKLWNAYDSIEEHQQNMKKYGLNWGVTRIGAPEIKKTMRTNYQFLQVLDMNDDDIAEVCKPTVEWLRGVVRENYEYKLLYLLGKIAREPLPEMVWDRVQDNAIKALMIEPELINDTYLSEKIARSIEKKTKEAYIGKLIVEGGFNFIYSDPYALAEYVFGMEVKGLLKEFEHYASFWSDKGVSEIVSMRSPLTWRAEVNKLNLKNTDEMKQWYKYIPNGIIFNVWGNDRDIHSSADFDGDTCASTNNPVFLRCRYGGVPVLYHSEKAEKVIIDK